MEIRSKPGRDGLPRFYVRYFDQDGRRRHRACPVGDNPHSAPARRKAAEAFAAGITTRIRMGKVGIVEPTPDEQARRTVTIDQLADRFLDEYKPTRIKDLESYRQQLRSLFGVRIRPTLGARAASSITTADVERIVSDQRDARYADASINLSLSALSRLFTWARKVGAIDCDNPVRGADRPRLQSSLDFLDAREVGLLLAYVEEHRADLPLGLPAMIATAIYTGMRKGELFGLRWRDLDLEGRRLTVARSYTKPPKSGKARHLRLNPELVPTLRSWRSSCPTTPEGLVFPLETRGEWGMGSRQDDAGLAQEDGRSLLQLAGCHLPAKPWHALRHTFASHFMMAGGNILTLQKLLGHHTITHTLIYAHLAPDFLDEEIRRMTFARPSGAKVASLGDARRKRGGGGSSSGAGERA